MKTPPKLHTHVPRFDDSVEKRIGHMYTIKKTYVSHICNANFPKGKFVHYWCCKKNAICTDIKS